MRNPFLAAIAVFLVSALITVAIFWPGLQGSFFFDDGPSISQPEGVRLERLSADTVYTALTSGGAGPSGRPVAQLSFALNYYFSGFSPFAFKATNLAIHLVAGLFVFMLAWRLMVPVIKARMLLPVTGMLAMIWLLHPIQLLPVLHVVQRMTSLSALYLFAACLMHINGRQRAGAAGAISLLLAWAILWPLSYLSKENGILFPYLILAWELTLRRHVIGKFDRFARVLTGLLIITLAGMAVYAASTGGQWLWAGYEMRSFTLIERLLTEGRVLWFYLGLILLPRLEAFGLYHDDIALSASMFVPWTTLPALAGIFGLLWLAWWLRCRAPLASFGILWFLIGHALESTFLPLEIAHEHRNYVPLFGLLLAVGDGLNRLLASPGAAKTFGFTLAMGMLGYLPFVTSLRAHQFGDELRRTQIEAQHHRQSAQAQHDAGLIMAQDSSATATDSPAYALAKAHYELAGEIDPSAKMSWLGLISLNCRAGILVERAWIDTLATRLRETPFAPADRNVLYSLKELSINGDLCLERSDIDMLFAATLENASVSPTVRAILHSWRADYLMLVAHDLRAAQVALDTSLAIAPYNPSNRLKRAQVTFLQGRFDEARELLDRVGSVGLVNSERETIAMLKDCLDPGRTAMCKGK